jgi:ATP-dependent helicase/nuclease subunit A
MGYISDKEHAAIDPWYLYRFFRSDIGSRCKKVKKIYRETPFNVELKEIGTTGSHPVLQGVIDLFFEEEDGIVLVDYKTDLVSKGQEEVLIQRYKKQIEYYAYALSVITGKKVKDKFIYSFFLSKEIQMKS